MNNEQPYPMGADGRYRGQVLGFPITLSGGPNAHIELRNVDLRDQRGKKVPCKIAPLTATAAARNTAVCTPYEPLRTGMLYRSRERKNRTTGPQCALRSRLDIYDAR